MRREVKKEVMMELRVKYHHRGADQCTGLHSDEDPDIHENQKKKRMVMVLTLGIEIGTSES
ncbi:hypothetical protein PHMEG_00016478 [Phytophthora megakarya]|uniref:Uncharacterized protein n=1 Tax=Phytophthora megakarya TaxID=4795 RepID=A0A225VYR0_9STRA|nr:hypothetical protein PHMEG_00016478 [Phytophthora megakarya]